MSEVKIIKIYSVFVKFIVAIECSIMYSHLSNKREIMLTDFEEKNHPPRTFPPSTFIGFLDFFHPPLLVYCSYVLRKIPPSTFIPPSTLLILQLVFDLETIGVS